MRGGTSANRVVFKVHIDGYNLVPFLTEEGTKSPREGFIYFDDDGNLVAIRFQNWKAVFLEQRSPGTLQVWLEPFTVLRCPKLYNLRTDPFERADITSNTYFDWYLYKSYLFLIAQAAVAEFMATFEAFRPRQKPASFTIEQGSDKLLASAGK